MEITKAAEFAWRKVKSSFKPIKLDEAGEDIIKEYLRAELTRWQFGEAITTDSSAQTAQKVLQRRRQDTTTFDGVSRVLKLLSPFVAQALEAMQRDRNEEAQRLASSMSAIKV